jgi:hypothetical protein
LRGHPVGRPALLGVLQNFTPALIIDQPPFLDLVEGPEAP